MKNLKKVFAVIMALAMIFALSVTAFAATTVSTTEDTSVLTLTSAGNTVTYQAVTVDGGWKDNQYYPTTTVYSYAIKTSSTTNISVSAQVADGNTIKVNDVSQSSTFYLDANSHNTLEVYNGNTLVRSFTVDVVDSGKIHVNLEINCYNAKAWLDDEDNELDSHYADASAAYSTLSSHVGGFNSIGKMSDVITVELDGGATARDLLDVVSGMTVTGSSYVSAIDGLGEGMCGGWSGWCYVTATETSPYYTMPWVAASSYALSDGELIIWVYTCDFADIDDAIAAVSPAA